MFKNEMWRFLIISIAFSCFVFAGTASAEISGDYEYEDNQYSGVTITYYHGNEKKVKVPAKLGGKNVTSIGVNAFEAKAFRVSRIIEEVTLPDTVTRLEEGAFWSCYSLKKITMSRNIEYIPETAFGEAKGEFKPVANFTMYGYNNTAAELFASLKGIKFVSIGESDMGLKQVKNFNVGEIRGEIECRDVKKQEFATVILEYTPIKNIKDYAVYVYDSRTKKYEFYAIGDEFKNDEGKAELGVHVRYDKEYKFKIRAFSGTYVPSSGTYGCAGKFSKAITIKVKKSDIERSFIYMRKEQSVKLFSESFLKNNDLRKLNEDDKKIISINTKGKIKAKKNGYASLYFVNKKTKKYVWFLIHVEEKDKYSGSLHFPLE